MSMTDRTEQVAKAMWFEHVDSQGYPNGCLAWDEMTEGCSDKRYFRDLARAALASIATPAPDGLIERSQGRVDSAIELMGEALAALGGRLQQVDFIHSDSNPITDANAAAYERVGKAWDKLTAAIAKASPLPTWDHYAEEHVCAATPALDGLVKELENKHGDRAIDGLWVNLSAKDYHRIIRELKSLTAQLAAANAKGDGG